MLEQITQFLDCVISADVFLLLWHQNVVGRILSKSSGLYSAPQRFMNVAVIPMDCYSFHLFFKKFFAVKRFYVLCSQINQLDGALIEPRTNSVVDLKTVFIKGRRRYRRFNFFEPKPEIVGKQNIGVVRTDFLLPLRQRLLAEFFCFSFIFGSGSKTCGAVFAKEFVMLVLLH